MPPMALSTPASPTPETGDGDDLLLELRAFLSCASGNSYGSIAMLHRNSDTALRLLRRLPAAKEGKLLLINNLLARLLFPPMSVIFAMYFGFQLYLNITQL